MLTACPTRHMIWGKRESLTELLVNPVTDISNWVVRKNLHWALLYEIDTTVFSLPDNRTREHNETDIESIAVRSINCGTPVLWITSRKTLSMALRLMPIRRCLLPLKHLTEMRSVHTVEHVFLITTQSVFVTATMIVGRQSTSVITLVSQCISTKIIWRQVMRVCGPLMSKTAVERFLS